MSDWRIEAARILGKPEAYVEPAKVDNAPRAPAENHDLRWLWGGDCDVETGAKRHSGDPVGTGRETPENRTSKAIARQGRLLRAFSALTIPQRAVLHQCYDPHRSQAHRERERENEKTWRKWGPAARAIAATSLDLGKLEPAEVLMVVRLAVSAHDDFAKALAAVDEADARELELARTIGQAKSACRLARIRAGVVSKAKARADRVTAWLVEMGLGVGR